MNIFGTKEIRNVGIVGHGDVGKTSLVAAMLFDTGATSRLGRVDEGTTVTDYDEDEVARKITIHTALAHCEWAGAKINILDTPGYAAFILDAKAALRVCDAALVVVDAVNGVEVQTEKGWGFAKEFGLPRIIVINKMDRERANFEQAVASATEAFDRRAVPIQLPMGSERNLKGVIDLIKMRAFGYSDDPSAKPTEGDIPAEFKDAAQAAREKILDVVAEGSEELMEKYFADGTLSDEDLIPGIKTALRERRLFPIVVSAATQAIGTHSLLDSIVSYGPAPSDLGPAKGHPSSDSQEAAEREVSDSAPYSALVFKTIADPFAGRISVFKVYSGAI